MIDSSLLLELGIKKRNKEITTSWQELADTYSKGFFATGEAYRCWVKAQLKSSGKISNAKSRLEDTVKVPNYKQTTEINKDGSQSSDKILEMTEEDSKDVEFLLRAHGYDVNAWELISARSNIWQAYSTEDKVQNLYASKITVKPRKENEFSTEILKNIFSEIAREYKSPVHTPTRYDKNGKMLEITIADLHLGKLAWDGDSNDTYNHEIARERFFHIINDAITRTGHYKFEKILFVWSNDFFHFDTLSNTTTAGTRQDTNLKLQQLFKLGVRMLIEAVDMLSTIAPVETFYIGSNHDMLMSYFATEYLSAWFRNDSNVTVDTDPKIRKYIEFGECLIQFSHGHAEGKRIGDVMSVEEREAWGRCKFTEVHAGHFHSERTVTKDNGVIIRYLGSPSGNDTWHYNSGYVGAVKKGQSFVWDRSKGLLDVIYTSVG